MFNRKKIKLEGKTAFKANYWQCVIAALLFLIICGSTTARIVGDVAEESGARQDIIGLLSKTVLGEDGKKLEDILQIDDSNAGVASLLVHQVEKSGSGLTGILNTLSNMVLGRDIGPRLLAVLALLITLLYTVFVKNILEVGQMRFFLENKNYSGTKMSDSFFIYKVHRTVKAAKVMFMRDLFTCLWSFTIVGGIIKLYSYRMVTSIVAENPDVSWSDALRISKKMMQGSKWKAFVLDLSFLGWKLLSYLTLGVLEVLYVSPYYRASGAELYLVLRQNYISVNKADTAVLSDILLTNSPADSAEYPAEELKKRFKLRHEWISTGENREYSVLDYVMIFFSFMMIGYIYEVVYAVLTTGAFVNRGTLYGPWLPIYGCGGTAALIILKKIRTHPIVTFFLSVLMCGIIEYTSAWYLETFKHTKYWDYSGFFMNIQGRVCLEGLVVFGLGCMLAIYLVAPSLAGLYERIPKKARVIVMAAICLLFIADIIISHVYPNMAAGVPIT